MKIPARKLQMLRKYFQNRDDVALAFVFGSQAKGYARKISDWDIGVYFKPEDSRRLELEIQREYPAGHEIWRDVARIVGAEVDLAVLNRAASPLVFTALNSGVALALKDRALYLRILEKTSYEAIDFWNFTYDFWKIRERSLSLSPADRDDLIRHLVFLENELSDLERFSKVDQTTYVHDKDLKRLIERWVENLVMSALDIAKVVLASEKKQVPDSYADMLRATGLYYFDEKFAEALSSFADLRNIIAHEYLDYRWQRIQKFIVEARAVFPRFIARMKEIAGA